MQKLINLENKEKQHKETVKDLLEEFVTELPIKKTNNSIKALVSTLKPYMKGVDKYIKMHQNAIKEAYDFVIVQYKTKDSFWAIYDKNLIDILKNTTEDKYSDIIVNYYKENNYEKIKELFSNWQQIPSIKDRMKIISSCFNLMQTEILSEDLCNAIIPTLTAQITGIIEDTYYLIPTSKEKEIRQSLGLPIQKTQPSPKVTAEYLWQLKEGQDSLFYYSIVQQAIMLNRGKLDKLTEEDIAKYNKYRHKIMHGDKMFLNYGTEENLIRSWLELDMLIKIYDKLAIIQKRTV